MSKESIRGLLRAFLETQIASPRLLSIYGTPFDDELLDEICKSARFGQLNQLVVLYLNETNVTEAGVESLVRAADEGGLPRLKRLRLWKTGVELPTDLRVSSSASAIFEYFRNRSERILPEFKLLLMGQGRVGKSHIRKRLQGHPEDEDAIYYFNALEDSTHDVDVEILELDSGQEHLGKCTARVWDFGGQEELQSAHGFFLGAHRCFYLLVIDATRPPNGPESNQIDYWLRLIAHHSRQETKESVKYAPVIILYTQCDAIDIANSEKNSSQEVEYDDPNQNYLDRVSQENQPWRGANVVDVIRGYGWSHQVETIGNHQLKKMIKKRHADAATQLYESIRKHTSDVLEIDINTNPNLNQRG